MARTTYRLERALWKEGLAFVAGVDEVGMGCLAGPVVAAAVILRPESRIDFIKDSKILSEKKREIIAAEIKEKAVEWGIGEVDPEEVDRLNIHGAALEAMRRAVASLVNYPEAVLSDAFKVPGIDCHQEAIIKGDTKVRSIAAASIVAKVHRDSFMKEMDNIFPEYGFAKHKGYGTLEHRGALKEVGPCLLHRKSCALVRENLE